jgi:hypothetical protein
MHAYLSIIVGSLRKFDPFEQHCLWYLVHTYVVGEALAKLTATLEISHLPWQLWEMNVLSNCGN